MAKGFAYHHQPVNRKSRAARTPEKAEQSHIVQLLRSIGGAVYVMGTHRRRDDHHGTMQTPGIPDLMAFLPIARNLISAGIGIDDDGAAYERGAKFGPCLLFVECKAVGGRLRPEQQAFQLHCDVAKVAHVVGGLDAVIAWLTAHGYVNATQFPHYRQPREGSATV